MSRGTACRPCISPLSPCHLAHVSPQFVGRGATASRPCLSPCPRVPVSPCPLASFTRAHLAHVSPQFVGRGAIASRPCLSPCHHVPMSPCPLASVTRAPCPHVTLPTCPLNLSPRVLRTAPHLATKSNPLFSFCGFI